MIGIIKAIYHLGRIDADPHHVSDKVLDGLMRDLDDPEWDGTDEQLNLDAGGCDND